jgi:hypothetical protein
MRDSGSIELGMAEESNCGLMGRFMKENGLMIVPRAMEG